MFWWLIWPLEVPQRPPHEFCDIRRPLRLEPFSHCFGLHLQALKSLRWSHWDSKPRLSYLSPQVGWSEMWDNFLTIQYFINTNLVRVTSKWPLASDLKFLPFILEWLVVQNIFLKVLSLWSPIITSMASIWPPASNLYQMRLALKLQGQYGKTELSLKS